MITEYRPTKIIKLLSDVAGTTDDKSFSHLGEYMDNSYISELLATDGYIQVNKKLIKTLGLHEAIIIGELCSEYNYWKIKGDLVEDSFYSTRENIEENTGLSEHYQRKAVESLINAELISVVKRGIPAKNYYRINFDKLLTTLTSSCQSHRQLDVNPIDINKHKETNINNKDIITINSNNTEFLGKIKNTKKKSLYEKCYDHILEFTNNVGLIDALTEYLKIRLQMKDKPLYEGTWKGMLKKLDKMDNQIDVVNTSIERGWASFFEQKSYSKGKEKFGEDDNIKSVKGEFDSSGETF